MSCYLKLNRVAYGCNKEKYNARVRNGEENQHVLIKELYIQQVLLYNLFFFFRSTIRFPYYLSNLKLIFAVGPDFW